VWTITNQYPTRIPGDDNPFIAFREEQDTFSSPSVAEEFARGMRLVVLCCDSCALFMLCHTWRVCC
jgi:hypothetical protein